MGRPNKFIKFLSALTNNENHIIVEAIKNGYYACFENANSDVQTSYKTYESEPPIYMIKVTGDYIKQFLPILLSHPEVETSLQDAQFNQATCNEIILSFQLTNIEGEGYNKAHKAQWNVSPEEDESFDEVNFGITDIIADIKWTDSNGNQVSDPELYIDHPSDNLEEICKSYAEKDSKLNNYLHEVAIKNFDPNDNRPEYYDL